MKKTNQSIFYWVSWLVLVILWNFGFPEATPFSNLKVALSIIFILIKKKK